jgi:hypothetical protein
VRPCILPRLSLDVLGIRLLEESCQLRAKLREMIKKLCVRKIVRSRNLRVLVDRSDPGLKDLLPVCEHKVSKPSDGWDPRLALAVTSDERNPPNLISDVNTGAVLAERIPTNISTRKQDLPFCEVTLVDFVGHPFLPTIPGHGRRRWLTA